jgi:hypothetical protein
VLASAVLSNNNYGSRVWAACRGGWEIIPTPQQLYVSLGDSTVKVAKGDTGNGVFTAGYSLYCWIDGAKTTICQCEVKSLWQSGGYNWDTNTPDSSYQFALLAGRDYPVLDIIDYDATNSKPIVLVDPGQQTFQATTAVDVDAVEPALVSHNIVLGSGNQKVNAWTLVNLNAFATGTIIPSGTPCLVTEVRPGVFYSLLSPQNPVAWQEMSSDTDGTVLLRTLGLVQPLYPQSGDTNGQVLIGFAAAGAGIEYVNPGALGGQGSVITVGYTGAINGGPQQATNGIVSS